MTDKHSTPPWPLPEVYLTKVLGFRTESPEPGRTQVELELQPCHLNITGVVHGGFLMTVLDTLMGHAIFTHLGDPQVRIATSSMTTHFLRTVREGRLVGEGRVLSDSDGYLSAEAELRDGQGRLVTSAQAQFTHLPVDRAGK